MTERINSILVADEGASWQAAGPTTLQAEVPDGSTVMVQIIARLDANAPWALVGGWRPASDPFYFIPAKVGESKVTIHSNVAGQRVRVWSVE